jgi:hypothetical protein
MNDLRLTVLHEIKRLAAGNGGRPPGRRAFERNTAIKESEWLGVIWARWSDALVEAGFAPNKMQGRADRDDLLGKLSEACREQGRMLTSAEFQLRRGRDPNFPSYKTYESNFGAKDNIIWELRLWVVENADASLLELLPTGRPKIVPRTSRKAAPSEGYVYLLQSGQHYKIGRSDELEKRVKQISIALPESVKLAHAIRTDDPPGIEAYWHRRFADRRANGEWFKLTPADVLAFKRRKYQ